jgi:magnesium chelatase family protein
MLNKNHNFDFNDRIIKVARTVADLEAAPEIRVEHLAEAINYRSLDKGTWGI